MRRSMLGTMKKVTPHPKHTRRRLFLQEWRKHRNNMTQAQLAERSGVTQGLISQLENNKSDYTGNTLNALARALDCEPADLIMRNPLDTEAPWSIWDTLAPPERRQAVEIMKTLKRIAGG